MATPEQREQILKEITDHYKGNDKPLFLSSLGSFISEQNIDISPATSLQQFVALTFGDTVKIVQHPEIKARIAVSTPEAEKRVLEQIYPSKTDSLSDDIYIKKLPFSLFVAFCVTPNEGKHLYYRIKPKFLYFFSDKEEPGDSCVEITQDDQPLDYRSISGKELSDSQKLTILPFIKKWAKANNIELQNIVIEPRKSRHSNIGVDEDNALFRLLNAQDEDIRNRINIPADIAMTLMKLS